MGEKASAADNTPEAIRLRKDRNNLVIAGTGVIVFAVWGFLRSLLFSYLQAEALLEEQGLAGAVAISVLVIGAGVAELVIRVRVGLAARSEGLGRIRGRGYLVWAVLLAAASLLTCALLAAGIALTQDEWIFERATALLLELISLITLIQMLLCAGRVRSERRAVRETGGA